MNKATAVEINEDVVAVPRHVWFTHDDEDPLGQVPLDEKYRELRARHIVLMRAVLEADVVDKLPIGEVAKSLDKPAPHRDAAEKLSANLASAKTRLALQKR